MLVVGARCRPRSGGDARAASKAATSSTRWPAPSPARRARRLRWRAGRRRRLLHPVQVPAGAERDGAARARSCWCARAAGPVRGPPRDAVAGAHPAVAAGVGGAPRGVRRTGHRVARRSTLVRGLDPERKVALLGDEAAGDEMRYDLFLGVPKHRVPAVVAESGHDRGRLGPGRFAHAGDPLPRRVRGRRRHERRHAQGGRLLRGPGGRRGRPPHRSRPRRRGTRPTTASASATSSSAPTRSPGWRSPSCRANRRPARSPNRRSSSPRSRASSGPSRIRRWFGREWSAY